MGSGCGYNHVQVVVADGHAQDLAGILLHFGPYHRLEFVLNAAGVDLGAGDDHTQLPGLVGLQLQELFLPTQGLRLDDLRFLGDQGDDAHGGQPCAGFHGIVIRQGGDGDIADGVHRPQQLRVHPQHAPGVGHQQHLALGGLGIVGALHGSHGGQTAGTVLLVEFPCVFLPDKHGPLAQIQKLRHVFLGDDMAAAEGCALEAVAHGGNIVAQGEADGLFDIDFLHV